VEAYQVLYIHPLALCGALALLAALILARSRGRGQPSSRERVPPAPARTWTEPPERGEAAKLCAARRRHHGALGAPPGRRPPKQLALPIGRVEADAQSNTKHIFDSTPAEPGSNTKESCPFCGGARDSGVASSSSIDGFADARSHSSRGWPDHSGT
jgi:hypothetical protein